MKRSEVYSWRLTPALKHALEARAAERGVSLSELLDAIARDWLRDGVSDGDAEAQRRLHDAVSRCAGTIAGGDAARSRSVRRVVRENLRRRRTASP